MIIVPFFRGVHLSRRTPSTKTAERALRLRLAAKDQIVLYELDQVRGALGLTGTDVGEKPRDTEHQARLAAILDKGEEGCWRTLLSPPTGAESAVGALVLRAPHLGELGSLVTMHLRSARVIGLPTQLPPILLVGAPGLGKSWMLSRLSTALGLPYRRYAMGSSSLSEGVSGAHPSWRNAQAGLVARTLLTEAAANPILFVDEFDKTGGHFHNSDPYRAFYALLDPHDACEFVDEYLGFPVDASNVLWIMAANDTTLIPAPILDRLKVLVVPEPDDAQRARIAASIYVEANATRRCFFEAELGAPVIERLIGVSPREMRKSLDEAMVRASAEGRRRLKPDDVVASSTQTRRSIGFCQ